MSEATDKSSKLRFVIATEDCRLAVSKQEMLIQLQCISSWLSRRDKKWELSVFVQVTTAVFISSGFHSAVVTCTNKDNSHFLSPLDNQLEIHCKQTVLF